MIFPSPFQTFNEYYSWSLSSVKSYLSPYTRISKKQVNIFFMIVSPFGSPQEGEAMRTETQKFRVTFSSFGFLLCLFSQVGALTLPDGEYFFTEYRYSLQYIISLVSK